MEPYKLKTEIKEFILQKAKEHPEIGCRKLTGLIQETFQANISKSTISSLLKSAGLNKAIGRRRIHPKALPPAPSPAIQNPEVITNLNDDETLPKAEQLPSEAQESQECGIWFLKAAELCLGEIGQAQAAVPQLFSELVSRSAEVLALKFILEDNSFFFLDAGCHSIWTTERIPERLSVGLHNAKAYINERILSSRQPLILQAAPGFDTPTPALLNFIDAFQAEKPGKAIRSIELYSADNLLIDTIKLDQRQEKRYFIIGLWPWQYKNRDFGLTHRLLSIKATNDSKKLDIITNLELDKQSDHELTGHYLTRWPNLELGYQDFLEEIGHFIRSPKTQVRDKCPILPNNGEGLTYEQLLSFWRLILNNYCQRHFFPLSYQDMDFLVLQERFYHLKCTTNINTSDKLSLRGSDSDRSNLKSVFQVTLLPPRDFPYFKDLQYACQRVNEADIRLGNGLRLDFEIP